MFFKLGPNRQFPPGHLDLIPSWFVVYGNLDEINKSRENEVNNLLKRDRIVRNLEVFQDIIVISLCVALFCVILLRFISLYITLIK
ncbi:hypothetical protein [Cylindrospermopsis raciborskii]|uniref:hypothetical protein n=1 Tax=Cylindrospermopsis raciborskii TaxID=77022 RepID=UPI000778CA15|nr:hypothetical protein [Cylindrospermopsis raciborskii]MCZ2200919.1 hypothetical protein [Cylindrospermopsis raciborskii PAMP2012]MCZ2206498.1 hypothetical protein [Cylindrospermopsis raciborskii PAMP2011]